MGTPRLVNPEITSLKCVWTPVSPFGLRMVATTILPGPRAHSAEEAHISEPPNPVDYNTRIVIYEQWTSTSWSFPQRAWRCGQSQSTAQNLTPQLRLSWRMPCTYWRRVFTSVPSSATLPSYLAPASSEVFSAYTT